MEQRPTWDDGKEKNYGIDPVVNGLLNLKLKASILLGKNLKLAGSSKLGTWEVFIGSDSLGYEAVLPGTMLAPAIAASIR